ncbi:hypothetical protein A9R05_42710 (plasmid) [Burkholderia sp. KK1]|uniref:Uncharacterized protein n=1 Tax=Burkholderia sp. M701 TaxID=326454 RepID=V5YN31_9BURK|nr:hypothetical protein [Burkholderia sp. M701]AQH05733.1 hypothetical protein A9R05_42710 [Burkholderia sp. KK1]BAO18970.1 hypothetical protein [Burkholderia sp. M701]
MGKKVKPTEWKCRDEIAFDRLISAIGARHTVAVVRAKRSWEIDRFSVDECDFTVNIILEMGMSDRLNIEVNYWRDKIIVRPLESQVEEAITRVVEFVDHAVALTREMRKGRNIRVVQ